MMDRESDVDLCEFRSLKQSEYFSDCLGLRSLNGSNNQNAANQFEQVNLNFGLKEPSIYSNDGDQCYRLLFSSVQITKSLKKRNENLELKCLENSQSEPEQIYYRRRSRLMELKTKQNKQLDTFNLMKRQETSKYNAFVSFLKIFSNVKASIMNIRNDYYSHKTFNALKNMKEQDLRNAAKVANNIFRSVMSLPPFSKEVSEQDYDERLIQFLIIPRFLISKQKIYRFIQDQKLQDNFKLLIYSGCLGHYNNEANKKLPQENYMNHFRKLIVKKNGHQKYKRICSINHGGKMITLNRQEYFNLFNKSLDCLKSIDRQVKEGAKLQNIIKQLSTFEEEQQTEEQSQAKVFQLQSRGREILNNTNNIIEQQKVIPFDMVSYFLNSEYKDDRNGELKHKTLTKTQSKKEVMIDSKFLMSRLKKAASLPTEIATEERVGKFMKRTLTYQIVAPPQISEVGIKEEDDF